MSNILKEIELIHVAMESFSGKRRLDESEDPFGDDDVVTTGSKWVIDKTHLNPFGRLKGEYRRICLREGSAFMGGFAVPKGQAASVLKQLAELQKEWAKIVESFLQSYPTYVDEWAKSNPTWDAGIRKAAPSIDKLKQSFRFSFQAYEINPSEIPGAGQMLQEECLSLPMQVCKEVANDLRNNFNGSEGQVTQRARRCLVRARDKYLAFQFLDPALADAAAKIQMLLDWLPQTGPIKDHAFLALAGMIAVLTQPHKVMAGMLSTQIPSGPLTQELFDEAAPVTAPVAVAPVALPETAPAAPVAPVVDAVSASPVAADIPPMPAVQPKPQTVSALIGW